MGLVFLSLITGAVAIQLRYTRSFVFFIFIIRVTVKPLKKKSVITGSGLKVRDELFLTSSLNR